MISFSECVRPGCYNTKGLLSFQEPNAVLQLQLGSAHTVSDRRARLPHKRMPCTSQALRCTRRYACAKDTTGVPVLRSESDGRYLRGVTHCRGHEAAADEGVGANSTFEKRVLAAAQGVVAGAGLARHTSHAHHWVGRGARPEPLGVAAFTRAERGPSEASGERRVVVAAFFHRCRTSRS